MKSFLTRTLTALGILTIILACVFWLRQYHLIATDIIIFAFSLLAGFEMFKSLQKAGSKPMGFAVIAALVLVLPLTYFLGAAGLIITLAISVIIALSIFVALHEKYELKDLAVTVFNVVYPVIIMNILIVMNHSDMGLYSLFTTFAVVVCTDTMAYLVGVTCKGPKLCPSISPKKTISGAIGGFIGGMLGATIAYLLFDYFGVFANFKNIGITTFGLDTWANVLIMLSIGLISSIVAEVGDLGASIIKRKIGIKDYGNIFPGHGGAMDRIDSFLFVIPIVYLVFEIFFKVA